VKTIHYKWAPKGKFDSSIVNQIRRKVSFTIQKELYDLTAQKIKLDERDQIKHSLSRDFLQSCYALDSASISTSKKGNLTVVSHGLGIPELSFDINNFQRPGTIATTKELPGTSVSIMGPKACRYNYGHWFIDGLARLDTLHQTVSTKSIDYYLVPKLSYDFQVDSLRLLGIPKEKIIELGDSDSVFCEKIYFATDPRGPSSQITGLWILDFLRNTLGKSTSVAPSKGKRIYISRKDSSSRGITNEDKIIPILSDYGFEALTLKDFSLEEKISMFQSASIVIGMSGAGLINLAFSNKGTHLLELFPSNFVNYFYYAICAQLGFEYDYLVQKKRGIKSLVSIYHSNIVVNTQELEKKLSQLN
jgi:hypothetical protein